MTARIYKPAKTAMQSGTAKTKEWVLDFEPESGAYGGHTHGMHGHTHAIGASARIHEYMRRKEK